MVLFNDPCIYMKKRRERKKEKKRRKRPDPREKASYILNLKYKFSILITTLSLSLSFHMSEPIILSDEEDHHPSSTPFHSVKRRRTGPGPNPTVLILDDDDLAPHWSTASAATPYVESPSSDIEVVECTGAPSGDLARLHHSDHKFSGSSISP